MPLFDTLDHRNDAGEADDQIVELAITDEMRGPGGGVHGGLIGTLVDCAGASAISRVTGRPVVTSCLTLNFLSAARVGPLRAVGTPLRVTDRMGVAEVKVFDAGKDDRLVASGLVTIAFLEGEWFERRVS